MALSGSAKTDIKLEAVDVYWGTEFCASVDFGVDGDTGGDLDGEYWTVDVMGSDLETTTGYYFWLDNGVTSVDPMVSGKTGIAVSYTNGDSGATIAAAFLAALPTGMSGSQSGSVVTFENDYIGKTSEDFTTAPALTFTTLQNGLGGSLGSTAQGGSTLNMEAQSVDLVSDQTGGIVLGQVYTGSTASVEMTLIEMTKERWEVVVGSVTGDVHTPSGGTRLVGYGESRLYQNLFDLGGKLILHPIRLDASDRSEDIIFWRSAPLPSSYQYSGQDIAGMELSFVAYNDKSKPEAISLFAQGDWDQDL